MQPDPWWRSAVVYQVYPRSFADGDGDGVGDLVGLRSRLDHLQDLGVDVLWLSPVYRSPMDDNGYDISDYQDVEPVFGTLDDLDALLADLHGRGMRLLMDLVVNHTSDEHPWFVASRSSRDDPKRDWYWWRPPRAGMEPGAPGAEPTNWSSSFSGSAWELDEATGEYYLHLFSRKQPDLNWENPEVRAAVYEMMRWWLDRGVDGFRMDVINFISKDTSLPDASSPTGALHVDGFQHYVSGPRIHEFLQEMHREVFAGRDGAFLTVGEMPGVTVDDARLFTDPARDEVDMVFQFEHVQLDHGLDKWDVRELDLRDLQPRVVSRFGDDGACRVESAKMLATVLHLHRGTPYVYQGEEIGMANFPFTSVEQFRDIESVNHWAHTVGAGRARAEDVLPALQAMSRDNARTPVQWDASPHAGFTTGEPWLAVNPDHVEVNVAAQRDDPDSVLAHYRRLIALRHAEPVVVSGDFTMLLPQDERVYAFTRTLDGTSLLVLGNFSGEPAPAPVPEAAEWAAAELLVGRVGAPGTDDDPIVLAPWEGRAYRRCDSRRG